MHPLNRDDLHLNPDEVEHHRLNHLVEVEHVDGCHLTGGATGTGGAVKAGHLLKENN